MEYVLKNKNKKAHFTRFVGLDLKRNKDDEIKQLFSIPSLFLLIFNCLNVLPYYLDRA